MTTITATGLARDTRCILDRVNQRHVSVEVRRNHSAVARLMPVQPTMTATEALAGLHPDLIPSQGKAWLEGSRRRFADEVADPWA